MHHQGPIAGIASHGNLIATAGYDNKIILWDSNQRKSLARANHDHLVNQCTFSSDGRWLVSSSSDYSARVWAVPSLRLHAVLQGHSDDVDMAAFAPDDQRIATCALDRCVRIFDLSGRCLQEMYGHKGNVLSLAWTQDGRYVVTSSVDGTIRKWDTERGTEVEVTDLHVRTDSVEIGPDGTIYAGDDNGRIAIIVDGKVCYVQAHCAGVKKIAIDTRQGLLVSLSYDRTIAVWNIASPKKLQELSRSILPETIWARAATFLEDGRVATGTFGSTYALFNPKTSAWDLEGVAAGSAINAILNVKNRVYSVGDAGTVIVDGETVAEMGSLCNFLVAFEGKVFTGGQMGQVLDANSGTVLYEHHSPLNCGVSFIKQGIPHIAIGSYTGEILIFTLELNGSIQLSAELSVYQNAVKGLSTSDGLLFSVCASTDIAWHNISDWSLKRRINKAHERIANAGCVIGEAQFATVSRDRKLRLWGGGDDHEVFESPHPNSIKCICSNDTHTALLTGSYGGTLAMFDLVNKQWTSVYRPTISGISSIAWDGGSKQFLAASYDGHIYPIQA